MLIICSGEDSYRSLEKARELEAAYKVKYDAEGRSMERLPYGKDAVDPLLSLTSSASLFSERRFIRADGLVKECPKAKRDALITKLSQDVEMTIVVSVEEGELKDKELKPFTKLPKFYHYEFPILAPAQFMKWAMEYASKIGVKDHECIRHCAMQSQGNSWNFRNEIQKVAAGGSCAIGQVSSMNVFEVIDGLTQKKRDRWSCLRAFDDTQSVIAQIGSQSRSFSLVCNGHTKGVHPFVVKKLSSIRNAETSERYTHLVTAFLWSRTGRASPDEAIDVLG